MMPEDMMRPSMKTPRLRNPRAFSLIELVVTIVVVVLLVLTIAPAMASVRTEAENEQSKANLLQLGQGRDQYALDNQDRIFSYNWVPDEQYTLPDGRSYYPRSYVEAAQRQNQEILMRRTGRIGGVYKIGFESSRLPHRRFTHFILMDYLAGENDEAFSSQIMIDPADQNRLVWNERPLRYSVDSGVPYSAGEAPQGYDQSSSWSFFPVLQRWPFTSSYEIVPASWQADGPDAYVPISSTPNLYSAHGTPDLSGRYTNEVAFPSQKVHMHEDHDREQKRYPWFAYDHARVEKLMFDGSINSQPSGQAHDSYSPDEPFNVWRQSYVPIEYFPIPLGGFNDPTELNMRFRWTRDGLQGIDY